MGGCLSQTSKIQHNLLTLQGEKIILQGKVSEGAFGEIWKCKNIVGELLAAKVIGLQTKQQVRMFKKEVFWLNKLKQVRGVVKIRGSLILPYDGYQIGYILMEFCESSLVDQLKNRKFTAQETLKTILQLTFILKEIHHNGCLHLDIKPDNILLHGDQWKICDFGSCIEGQRNLKALSKKEYRYFSDYVQANSTLIYRSPELIQLNSRVGFKADIWMLGCIGYVLYYRKHPFEGEGKSFIVNAKPNYFKNGQVEQCLKGMLHLNPEKRWNQRQIIDYIQTQIGTTLISQ